MGKSTLCIYKKTTKLQTKKLPQLSERKTSDNNLF